MTKTFNQFLNESVAYSLTFTKSMHSALNKKYGEGKWTLHPWGGSPSKTIDHKDARQMAYASASGPDGQILHLSSKEHGPHYITMSRHGKINPGYHAWGGRQYAGKGEYKPWHAVVQEPNQSDFITIQVSIRNLLDLISRTYIMTICNFIQILSNTNPNSL